MKVKVNILRLFGAFTAGFVTYTILSGAAAEFIHFNSAASQLGTALITSMIAVTLTTTSIDRIK